MKPERLQEILLFEKNDIWDATLHMLDKAYQLAAENAVDPALTPEKREFEAGVAYGFLSAKRLLVDTREEALERANRKVKP